MLDLSKVPEDAVESVMSREEWSAEKVAESMTPKQFVESWCGWHLGDDAWATQIIDMFLDLAGITVHDDGRIVIRIQH